MATSGRGIKWIVPVIFFYVFHSEVKNLTLLAIYQCNWHILGTSGPAHNLKEIIFIDCILLRGQTGFFYFPSNVTIHF
jgi:hypothetical protein